MIAVLGSTGQLGTAILRRLGPIASGISRDELDLSQPASIAPWISAESPEAIVNCAAYTAVDAAEGDEETAHIVNALAVEQLALGARREGIRFITFSTDYVFDGLKNGAYVESDKTNPLSAYGRTKLDGERRALAAYPEALVIRTSWVLSGTHPNFAATMLRLIRQGPVRVVDDQRGRPTMADDLAKPVVECIDRRIGGILHLTNRGETTWFHLAQAIAQRAGLDPERVSPTTTADFPRRALRPPNSVLASERAIDLGLSNLPHYLDSLGGVVRSLIENGF